MFPAVLNCSSSSSGTGLTGCAESQLFPQVIDVLMTSERPQAHHISAAPVYNPYTLYQCTVFSRRWNPSKTWQACPLHCR